MLETQVYRKAKFSQLGQRKYRKERRSKQGVQRPVNMFVQTLNQARGLRSRRKVQRVPEQL
jgi:hypothetical protein